MQAHSCPICFSIPSSILYLKELYTQAPSTSSPTDGYFLHTLITHSTLKRIDPFSSGSRFRAIWQRIPDPRCQSMYACHLSPVDSTPCKKEYSQKSSKSRSLVQRPYCPGGRIRLGMAKGQFCSILTWMLLYSYYYIILCCPPIQFLVNSVVMMDVNK